jgi:hypothetical protein
MSEYSPLIYLVTGSLLITITVFLIMIYISTNGYIKTVKNNVNVKNVFYSFDPVGDVEVSNTYKTLKVASENTYNTDNYSNDFGQIKIKQSGLYEIKYNIQFETSGSSGGQYATFSCQILLNSNVVEGSQSSCFLKKQATPRVSSACTNTIVCQVENESIISVEFSRTFGTTVAKTKKLESSILITKL